MFATISGPDNGLGLLDFLGVGAYLLVTAAIVWWSSRKGTDTEDFFLAGRRMPWFAVGLSMMATLLSTLTYLSSPGEMIKNGVAMFIGYAGIPFAMAVVLLVWLPFMMRMKMTSAYEYLERRFNIHARRLAGLLFLMLRLGWMSMVVYTASLAMVEMTTEHLEWFIGSCHLLEVISPLALVIGAVGIFATIYTCVGGIRAVIWNDVLQAIMLFGGVLLILVYVAWATGTGPIDWWHRAEAASKGHTRPEVFSFDITVRMTMITAMLHVFFWTICTHSSDQVVLQRYFTTGSLGGAWRTYIVNTVSNVTIGALLSISGLALLYFYLEHPEFLRKGMSVKDSADKVMPYFYAYQLPAGLGGLILAGFLCDAMQTLASGVNSITAVATKDVFNRLLASGEKTISELTVARVLTLLVGLATTVTAYMVAYLQTHSSLNILDLMPKFFNLFLGPLATLFLIGMFVPRATARSAIPAVLGSVLISIVWSWWPEIYANCRGISIKQAPVPTITLAVGVPYLSGFVLATILSFLVEQPGPNPGRDYTWRAVLRRPLESR
jgi:SSS family solute:Na+ symporter